MTTVQIAVIQPLGVGKWAGSCRDKHRGAGKFCCPFFFPSASNFPFKKKQTFFSWCPSSCFYFLFSYRSCSYHLSCRVFFLWDVATPLRCKSDPRFRNLTWQRLCSDIYRSFRIFLKLLNSWFYVSFWNYLFSPCKKTLISLKFNVRLAPWHFSSF